MIHFLHDWVNLSLKRYRQLCGCVETGSQRAALSSGGAVCQTRACSAAGTGRSGSGPVSRWWWWCGPQSPLVVHQSWWMPRTRGGSAWSFGRLSRWWSRPAADRHTRWMNVGSRGERRFSDIIFWKMDLFFRDSDRSAVTLTSFGIVTCVVMTGPPISL